jgi:Holliday junction resolvase
VKIDPAIAARHWEEAAVEQLTARLRQQGYSIEREATVGGLRPDLIAKRPDGKIVLYEVKVPGGGDPAWVRQVAALREQARAMGGRFQLVLVRPPRDTNVQVDGLEKALERALLQQPPYQLGPLAKEAVVRSVGDLDISSVTIHEDGVEIDGDATVEVELFDADGNAFSQESLPLSFHAKLDRANRRHEFTKLRVDASSLTGEPTVASVPQPGDT